MPRGCCCVCALSFTLGLFQASAQGQRPFVRPNVLLVSVDDMANRHRVFLDRTLGFFETKGVILDNFFVVTPLCNPSRAAVLTGRYPHHTQMWLNSDLGSIGRGGAAYFRDSGLDESTLGVWLQDAGYRTALHGKYMNLYDAIAPDIPPGWDDWRAMGSPLYYHYQLIENGRRRYYFSQERDYSTSVLRDHTIAFIRSSVNATAVDRKPFFAYLNFSAPHVPATPAPPDIGSYAGEIPRPPNYNESDVSDKPTWVRNLDPDSVELDHYDQIHVNMAESLRSVDRAFVDIVGVLRDLEVLENTVILFFSDNGYSLGEHRLGNQKNSPYDESVRVPAMAFGPGMGRGVTSDALLTTVDLTATIVDLAGAHPQTVLDGRSFVPILNGSKLKIHDEIFIERRSPDPANDTCVATSECRMPSYAGIITQRVKYIKYGNGEIEYYDRSADFWENQSQHLTVDPRVLAELDQKLVAFQNN